MILVTGGAASGKSAKALELAGRAARRAFVATGQPLDDEMAERIRRHQASRGAGWETVEVPVDLARWFACYGMQYQSVVLDCLTLWVSNILGGGASDSEVRKATEEVIDVMRRARTCVVVVTNELGMGLVPMDPTVRRFRDLAGAVNQRFADAADEVHLVVSGITVRVK